MGWARPGWNLSAALILAVLSVVVGFAGLLFMRYSHYAWGGGGIRISSVITSPFFSDTSFSKSRSPWDQRLDFSRSPRLKRVAWLTLIQVRRIIVPVQGTMIAAERQLPRLCLRNLMAGVGVMEALKGISNGINTGTPMRHWSIPPPSPTPSFTGSGFTPYTLLLYIVSPLRESICGYLLPPHRVGGGRMEAKSVRESRAAPRSLDTCPTPFTPSTFSRRYAFHSFSWGKQIVVIKNRIE